MKITNNIGRTYILEIDDENYILNRVGTEDSSLMFNLALENHKPGDYYVTVHFFEGQWIYRDHCGDIIDNDLFYKVCFLIDEGVASKLIPYRKPKSV